MTHPAPDLSAGDYATALPYLAEQVLRFLEGAESSGQLDFDEALAVLSGHIAQRVTRHTLPQGIQPQDVGQVDEAYHDQVRQRCTLMIGGILAACSDYHEALGYSPEGVREKMAEIAANATTQVLTRQRVYRN